MYEEKRKLINEFENAVRCAKASKGKQRKQWIKKCDALSAKLKADFNIDARYRIEGDE